MPDWTSSMIQKFEYYEVDPWTWKNIKLIDTIKSCSIDRDSDSDTLGSATFDINESVGETYIRPYLVTIQNGIEEKHPLGTFLAQTPSSNFDGTVRSVTVDAYTPLIELKENKTPIGYYIPKDSNTLDRAYMISREHCRAPIVRPSSDNTLFYDFVADTDDTWLTYVKDLTNYAKYNIELDELSRVLFSPIQNIDAMQPIWTYTDDNSSILLPEISLDHDLYDIPNVVEVIYSEGNHNYYAVAINDDPTSPTSTINRGRKITYRETNPSMIGIPTDNRINEYAEQLLKQMSTLAYTISYTHAYCPVRLGDCVMINYNRADMKNIKARVISQSIKCEPGCPVTEKAVFTKKLWR